VRAKPLTMTLFTASTLSLDLHLLRSGLMIHLLAALAATALAAKWLTSDDECDATILGPYLTFLLCIKYLFPAAAVLFALENRIRHHRAGVPDVRLRAAILETFVLPRSGISQSLGRQGTFSARCAHILRLHLRQAITLRLLTRSPSTIESRTHAA
jgi:hypothetical protein